MQERNALADRALATFVSAMDALVDSAAPERDMTTRVAAQLAQLIRRDDWLADAYAKPHPQYYQQYLLHADPSNRYSIVSFVWGPGQSTPVHDHCTWGVIGVLRGAEISQAYRLCDSAIVTNGPAIRLEPGQTAVVGPTLGDIHRVSNAFDDRVSISIHVYGSDIGRQSRHVFDMATGASKAFVSGYANAPENGEGTP